ncbi:MAG: hypothetical protein ACE5FS_13435, partial [Paracoccaceae bacterium]
MGRHGSRRPRAAATSAALPGAGRIAAARLQGAEDASALVGRDAIELVHRAERGQVLRRRAQAARGERIDSAET